MECKEKSKPKPKAPKALEKPKQTGSTEQERESGAAEALLELLPDVPSRDPSSAEESEISNLEKKIALLPEVPSRNPSSAEESEISNVEKKFAEALKADAKESPNIPPDTLPLQVLNPVCKMDSLDESQEHKESSTDPEEKGDTDSLKSQSEENKGSKFGNQVPKPSNEAGLGDSQKAGSQSEEEKVSEHAALAASKASMDSRKGESEEEHKGLESEHQAKTASGTSGKLRGERFEDLQESESKSVAQISSVSADGVDSNFDRVSLQSHTTIESFESEMADITISHHSKVMDRSDPSQTNPNLRVSSEADGFLDSLWINDPTTTTQTIPESASFKLLPSNLSELTSNAPAYRGSKGSTETEPPSYGFGPPSLDSAEDAVFGSRFKDRPAPPPYSVNHDPDTRVLRTLDIPSPPPLFQPGELTSSKIFTKKCIMFTGVVVLLVLAFTAFCLEAVRRDLGEKDEPPTDDDKGNATTTSP